MMTALEWEYLKEQDDICSCCERGLTCPFSTLVLEENTKHCSMFSIIPRLQLCLMYGEGQSNELPGADVE